LLTFMVIAVLMLGSMGLVMQMLLLERLDVTGRPGQLLLDKEGGVYGDNEWTEQKLKKERLTTAPWYD